MRSNLYEGIAGWYDLFHGEFSQYDPVEAFFSLNPMTRR